MKTMKANPRVRSVASLRVEHRRKRPGMALPVETTCSVELPRAGLTSSPSKATIYDYNKKTRPAGR